MNRGGDGALIVKPNVLGSKHPIHLVFCDKRLIPKSSLVSRMFAVFVSRTSGHASSLKTSITSVVSNKEYAVCANRGSCDKKTGLCSCLWPKQSGNSDQIGGQGNHRDCGYMVTITSLS